MTSPRSFPEDWSVASGINCSVNDELEAKLPLSDTFDPRFGDDALLHWPPADRTKYCFIPTIWKKIRFSFCNSKIH
jgi:hypothetical protein